MYIKALFIFFFTFYLMNQDLGRFVKPSKFKLSGKTVGGIVALSLVGAAAYILMPIHLYVK